MNAPEKEIHFAARPFSHVTAAGLENDGLSPVQARVMASRGITQVSGLTVGLSEIIPVRQLYRVQEMATRLADAIRDKKRMIVVADYDADGATACAVIVRAMRAFNAQIDWLVPDRAIHGYGLTPSIVDEAADRHPDIIITVDNGIASVDGVVKAHQYGIQVLVTDHHLPGDVLPEADCIVNPNQPDCKFSSKNLAGCGVAFYVMAALQREVIQRNMPRQYGFSVKSLLDLVALGTIADVVRLDKNNRALVTAGLERIHTGQACAGINALISVSGRTTSSLNSGDIGFALGPRLNAAGRLDDMSLGIALLLTDDEGKAKDLAERLDALNIERKEIETSIRDEAMQHIDVGEIQPGDRYTITMFDRKWHHGVVGIVASRVKERTNRPSIVFAAGEHGEIKGSGRSINGFHLRDALDLVFKRHPGLIIRFGGHAMAAGLTLLEKDFERFSEAFEKASREMIDPALFNTAIETDGILAPSEATEDLVDFMHNQIWGQGFPPPVFHGEFQVVSQNVVAGKHLRLVLGSGGRQMEAMSFFNNTALPPIIEASYILETKEYKGKSSLQMIVQKWFDPSSPEQVVEYEGLYRTADGLAM